MFTALVYTFILFPKLFIVVMVRKLLKLIMVSSASYAVQGQWRHDATLRLYTSQSWSMLAKLGDTAGRRHPLAVRSLLSCALKDPQVVLRPRSRS